MGESDPVLFPQYESFIVNHLRDEISTLKKVAWLGLQEPYCISRFLSSLNPRIENHYFDIVSVNKPNCHKFDFNNDKFAYGNYFKHDQYDALIILRCSMYIKNHKMAIKEFKDFLRNDYSKFIWFEDTNYKDQKQSNKKISYYHDHAVEQTGRIFSSEYLYSEFSISHHHEIYGPDNRRYEQYILRDNQITLFE